MPKLDRPLNLSFEANVRRESVEEKYPANSGLSIDFITKLKGVEDQLSAKIKELDGCKGKLLDSRKEVEVLKKIVDVGDGLEKFISDITPLFYGKNVCYVDVGAFVGEVFIAIKKINKIKVREAHFFEPNKKSFDLLEKNIESYRSMPSLHAYNLGVGSKICEQIFSSSGSMTKVIDSDLDTDGDKEAFIIKMTTLDHQSKKFTDKKINLLKVDVEGFELEVFKGASKLLEDELIDIIYVEVGFNKVATQQTYFVDVENYLFNFGYRVFGIYEQKNEWIDDYPMLRRSNFAYISNSFAKNSPVKIMNELMSLKKDV